MSKLTTVFVLIVTLIACTQVEPTPGAPPAVGTPLSGPPGYTSVGGDLSFSPSAAGVTLSVNSVEVHQANPDGLTPASGYTYVVLDATVENNSGFPVFSQRDLVLVDEFSNQYAAWAIPFGRSILENVEPGETGNGSLVYQVPAAALSEELRLRWESDLHQARIEITLGDLTAELGNGTP